MENNQANASGMNMNNMLGNLSSMFKNMDLSKLKNMNLNNMPASVKQFGNDLTSRVGKMSTTQKVVGGALLAGGLYYLNNRNKSHRKFNSASF